MPNLEIFDSMMPAWENAQKPMDDEQRWKNTFPDSNQTLLMHVYSVMLTMRDLQLFFRQFNPGWDEQLLMDSAMLHDHGEPLSGGDEDIESRTEGKEVREWVGFAALVNDKPEWVQQPYLRAFALQYAIKDCDDDLPEQALAFVREHRQHNMAAAWFFDFVECMDYFRSARVGFRENLRHIKGEEKNHEGMFEHVFGNTCGRVERACEHLPLLREFWTSQLQSDFAEVALEDAKGSVPPAFIRREA